MNIGQRLTKIENKINQNYIHDPERAIKAIMKVINTACPDIEGEPLKPPKEKVTKEEWELFLEHSSDRFPLEEIEEMKASIISVGGFADDV